MAGVLGLLRRMLGGRETGMYDYEAVDSDISVTSAVGNSDHSQTFEDRLHATRNPEWLRIDAHGRVSFAKVNKKKIVDDLGVHYRDLRYLEPLVPTPYPAAIFIRDKALVVNLESLRMLVTKDKVLVLSIPKQGGCLNVSEAPRPDSPTIRDLIVHLCPPAGEEHLATVGIVKSCFRYLVHLQCRSLQTMRRIDRSEKGGGNHKPVVDQHLPYELRALEAGLSTALRVLEHEVADVEGRTVPALRSLLYERVSRRELTIVRHCRLTLSRLADRLKALKTSLEELLNDDDDMSAMYLARKEMLAAAEKERQLQEQDEWTGDGDMLPQQQQQQQQQHQRQQQQPQTAAVQSRPGESLATWGGRTLAPVAERDVRRSDSQPIPHQHIPGLGAAPNPAGVAIPSTIKEENPDHLMPAPSAPATQWPSEERMLQRQVSRSRWAGLGDKVATLMMALDEMRSPSDPRDINACESLLELYFLQVDSLLSRLTLLDDRITGAQHQLNLEMDHRRNELVALDLFVTVIATAFACVSMIGGVFGMNMKNGMEESQVAFWTTTGSSLIVATVLLACIIAYARWKRLLFIPNPVLGDQSPGR